MKVTTTSLSHKGQVRETNEDSYCQFEPANEEQRKEKGAIFIVADGMGGHSAGEIASKLAVDNVKEYYYSSTEKDPSKALYLAFEGANRVIFEKALQDAGLFGMGTTCTAMVIVGNTAYFAHVGDSRAYLLRRGKLKQITQDHSLVGDMIRSGMLSREDAKNHPKRNIITRSLGTHEEACADTPSSPLELEVGDVFLLCSDGLTAFVSDDEIRDILAANEPKAACKALIEQANKLGGKDNITAQVVSINK